MFDYNRPGNFHENCIKAAFTFILFFFLQGETNFRNKPPENRF